MSRARTPLKEIVSSELVSINPQSKLRESLAAMLENRVTALPVVDVRRHCVGVISVTDLLGAAKDLNDELNALSETGGLDHEALVEKLEHADLLTEQVQDWMSTAPISVGIEDSVQHAAKLILRHRVHRLVVLDEQRRVVGVVSTMDLLAVYVEGDGG